MNPLTILKVGRYMLNYQTYTYLFSKRSTSNIPNALNQYLKVLEEDASLHPF